MAARHQAKFSASAKLEVQRDPALAQADECLRAVREQFARSCLACLRHAPDATVQIRSALDLVEQARAALRGLSEVAGEE